MFETTRLLGKASDHRCARCGERAASWQHKVAKGRGGPTDKFNCVPLCGSGTTGCHGWAEANPHAARVAGFDVEGHFLHGRYVGPNESYQEYYGDGRAA